MKKFCLVYFVFFPFCLMAQPAFNAGVPHTNTTINWSPSASGSRIAVDYSARKIYIHNGTSWLEYEQGIDRITGAISPAYTPAAGQSLWAVNAVPELYYYTGSAWVCMSCQSGIVTDTTLTGDGTDGSPLGIAQQGATTGQVLKWDGSAWTPGDFESGAGIDTLPNYSTLRSYTGAANAVYITRGKNTGLFVRSASGTDNGGTIIVASNGVKWSRIIYNSTYRPEWWNENPTDTVYTNEINQANLLASANKGTVLFERNYAVDSLYNYFGQGYCIEAKSNVIYDVRGSIYLKSNAITAGRKLAVFVGWPGSHDIKFTGSGNIHMNTANNPNGVFGQETGQGIEVYGDTTTPTRNYTIEHLRFTGTFGNPINFKGGAPQTYAAPKHRDIYIHDVKYENFGEGAQIADAQNVYVSNCTGLTNSDYTFGDCFEFVRVKNAKIDGCYFRACCGGSGIDLFSAQETTVSNCTIINGSNGIDIQPDRFVVPAFTHSKNIIISNVTHDGQGESGQGINMSNNANTKLSNVFISDCYLTNSIVGIAIGPQADTMPGPVVIANTVVEKCKNGILANYVKDLSIQGGRIKKCSTYGIALERNYISGLGLYGVINISGTVVDSNNVGLYANVVSDVGFGGGISLDLRESNTNMITWAEAVKNSPVSFKNERSIIKRTTPGSLSNYSGVQTLRMTGSTGIAGFVGYFHGERLTVTGTNTGTCSLGFSPTDPGGLNLMNRNTFTPDSMLFVTFEYDKWNNRWNEVSRAKDYVGTLATGAIPFIETTGQKKYDAPNLYWNDNKKLGIGTNSPTSLPGWSGSAIHIYDAAGLPSLNLSSGANANVGIALEGSTRGNLWSNNGLDLTFSRSGSSSPLRIRSNYTGSAVTLFSLDPGTNIPQWLTTSAYKLPSGTDAQRPAGQVGFIRHNTTTNNFEIVRSGVTYENIVSTPISDTHTTNDVLTWNGTGWVSQAATGGIGGSIASTQIAYGSGTNTITGNSNFVYSGGNVGIGTTSTTARINVVGSGATSGTYTAQFHNSTGTNNALIVRDDGKIGVGTASFPGSIKLAVNGQIGGNTYSSSYLDFTGSTPEIRGNSGLGFYSASGDHVFFGNGSAEKARITSAGSIIVNNTTSATGTKIAMFSTGNTLVEGTIGSGLSISGGVLSETLSTSSVEVANYTLSGYTLFSRADANSGAIAITAGGSMLEGRTYVVRATRNSTNAVTVNAASGYTLGIDGDTTLSPTSYTLGEAEVIRLTLYPGGSVIVIDK